jgi:hypothetical protein
LTKGCIGEGLFHNSHHPSWRSKRCGQHFRKGTEADGFDENLHCVTLEPLDDRPKGLQQCVASALVCGAVIDVADGFSYDG